VRVFCRIVFHLFVAQYLIKAFNKGYFPIFLSTVPSAQLFISCPTLSCRPSPVNGALPCPLFHAKAKDTNSFFLLLIIEDSKNLISYNINIRITISKSQILNKKTMQNLPDTAWIQQR
jgi:hypothetical protein